MSPGLRISAPLLAVVLLTGCVAMDAPGNGMVTQLPQSASHPWFSTTMQRDVTQSAIEACRMAVERRTGSRTSVVGGHAASWETAVYLRVGETGAPWRCLVGRNGADPRTEYVGGQVQGGSASQLPAAPEHPWFSTRMERDVTNAAIQSCRSAVERRTGAGVFVVGGQTLGNETAVYLRAGEANSPWRCIVEPNGRSPRIEFVGDRIEGGSATQLPQEPTHPVFSTTMDRTVTQAAIDACRSAVQRRTGSRVSVVGGHVARGETAVYLRAGRENSPWRCLVERTGRNPRIEYVGGQLDDGAATQLPQQSDFPPFFTRMTADVTQAAIDACRSAVDRQTRSRVTVVGGTTSGATTAIYLRVGAANTPWRCLVDRNGRNPRAEMTIIR